MKFAKELDSEAVPEWREMYLDYRTGKKLVKAVNRAIQRARRGSPRGTPQLDGKTPKPYHDVSTDRLLQSAGEPGPTSSGESDTSSSKLHLKVQAGRRSSSSAIVKPTENDNLVPVGADSVDADKHPREVKSYGSIEVASPNHDEVPQVSSLHLPDPALASGEEDTRLGVIEAQPRRKKPSDETLVDSRAGRDRDSVDVKIRGNGQGPTAHPMRKNLAHLRFHRPTSSAVHTDAPLATRLLTAARQWRGRRRSGANEEPLPLHDYPEVSRREREFHTWMDGQLQKIEKFYQEREDEASHRLKVVRDQLHEMRDRRLEEVTTARKQRLREGKGYKDEQATGVEVTADLVDDKSSGVKVPLWLKPVETAVDVARGKAPLHLGRNTKEFLKTLTLPADQPAYTEEENHHAAHRDFARRLVISHQVPYRQAKKKLKLALREFYRGLELLKAYTLTNRIAFRKINKKYDKTISSAHPGEYMSEKIDNAWFVQSDVLDGHIVAVEDLYARYFERGNHKIAVGKLRAKGVGDGSHGESIYRNGLFVGAGLVLILQSLVYAARMILEGDPIVQIRTGYLLQLYGGIVLLLVLFLLFVLNCRTWTHEKTNYVFIFEFDPRNRLDWRQLAEIPCIFTFLTGLFMYLNFAPFASSSLLEPTQYPAILVGTMVGIIFLPLPILYHKARKWLLYSMWRLLLAGIYPVEFRDFFLGDMLCSLTYALGNIEVFFCLYANRWDNPDQCNSNHSRLFGFLTALPAVWRLLQCLRRYYDTRNVFPHLVNGGKYTFTILTYTSLSLYRLNPTNELKALFIFAAVVNGFYTSIWDLAMDWSLLDPFSRNRFLRDRLGFRRKWWYYLAMIVDPLIRFNFILYVIFVFQAQHSSVMSFIIALSEVCRRGFWSLFRLENEHCTKFVSFPSPSIEIFALTHPWCRSIPGVSRDSTAVYHPLLEVVDQRAQWQPGTKFDSRSQAARSDYTRRHEPISLLGQLQNNYLSRQLSSQARLAVEEQSLQLNRDRTRNHLQIRLITEPYLDARRTGSTAGLYPEDLPAHRRADSLAWAGEQPGPANTIRSFDSFASGKTLLGSGARTSSSSFGSSWSSLTKATAVSPHSTSRPAPDDAAGRDQALDKSSSSASQRARKRDSRKSAGEASEASTARKGLPGSLTRALTSVQAAVRTAHAQDSERKRRPSAAGAGAGAGAGGGGARRSSQQGKQQHHNADRDPERLEQDDEEELRFGDPDGGASSDEEEAELERIKKLGRDGGRAEAGETEELRRMRSGLGKGRMGGLLERDT